MREVALVDEPGRHSDPLLLVRHHREGDAAQRVNLLDRGSHTVAHAESSVVAQEQHLVACLQLPASITDIDDPSRPVHDTGLDTESVREVVEFRYVTVSRREHDRVGTLRSCREPVGDEAGLGLAAVPNV